MSFDPEPWTARVGALKAHSLRQSQWCEIFSEKSPGTGALLLEYAARRARRDPLALSAYLGLIDFDTVVERAGGRKMAAILTAAVKKDFRAAALVLEFPGTRHVADEIGPPPDPIVDRISLGHRKTAARGMRSHILERLLKDSDPAVIAEALRNPRLREGEVVAIASRRPCGLEIFGCLARAPEWIARPAVRKTIAMNPYAPPRLALQLLVSLPAQELDEVGKETGLHPSVRDGALEILGWD